MKALCWKCRESYRRALIARVLPADKDRQARFILACAVEGHHDGPTPAELRWAAERAAARLCGCDKRTQALVDQHVAAPARRCEDAASPRGWGKDDS